MHLEVFDACVVGFRRQLFSAGVDIGVLLLDVLLCFVVLVSGFASASLSCRGYYVLS